VSPGAAVSLGRVLPSGRSLAVGFALLAAGLGSYAAARETSLFAVRAVEVRGAPAPVARRVEAALAPLAGESLLAVDARDIDRALASLPDVRAVAFDRAFPRTLTVSVSAERPVAVLRRGSEAWLVSERGRVLSALPAERPAGLPRIWVARVATPREGVLLAEEEALRPAVTLGAVFAAHHGFFRRVRAARTLAGEVDLLLRNDTEVRLGSPFDIALKIAVANKILEAFPGASGGYVDVSVPERPVAQLDPQVSG
jgi:cell division protein FtsQ